MEIDPVSTHLSASDITSIPVTLPRDPIARAAKERFGIPALYPAQRLAIANTLDGVNQIVIFPTGGGKSLCFQLPSFFLKGTTLVIMPLLSLIADQMRGFAQKGIQAGIIKGGQTDEERGIIIDDSRKGKIKIILATPEAVLSPKIMKALSALSFSHLVIDEAHCVSEWGETFRPSYLELHKVIDGLNIPLVSAYTATASEQVIGKIRTILFRGNAAALVSVNPDRPNIFYRVIPIISKSHILTTLVRTKQKPLVIFTRSRKGAEMTARMLRTRLMSGTRLESGTRLPDNTIFFYHAGLEKEERKEVEQWFLKSNDGILCSTSAYGMGVDKPDIRTVIHSEVPPSVESYLQESGRAGRDKLPSESILLCSRTDEVFLREIADSMQQARYKQILDYALSASGCRRIHLLSLLDFTPENQCAGCDVCGNEKITKKPGEEEILSFLKKSGRIFTQREIRIILSGKMNYEVMKNDLDNIPGFGLLRDWETDDIEEAVNNLVEAGNLHVPQKGFWKYKMALRKKIDRRLFDIFKPLSPKKKGEV